MLYQIKTQKDYFMWLFEYLTKFSKCIRQIVYVKSTLNNVPAPLQKYKYIYMCPV